VSVGGTPLSSFAVTLCGFGLGALMLRRPWITDRERRRRLLAPALAAALPVLAAIATRFTQVLSRWR